LEKAGSSLPIKQVFHKVINIVDDFFIFYRQRLINIDFYDIISVVKRIEIKSEVYLSKIEKEFGEKFWIFFEFLTEENKKYNLTAITEQKEVYLKHFLDSVMGESLFSKGENVVEIGSGAGFPSIPLKIIRPDLSFTLVESTGKKCDFLRMIVDKLGLEGVKILNMRAEDAAKLPIHRENYDVCCARAVARLNTLAEYCLPFVKVGGRFLAYKGDAEEECSEAGRAISLLGGGAPELYSYDLPENTGKRTIVKIYKTAHTPSKYPRGNGKERKQPL